MRIVLIRWYNIIAAGRKQLRTGKIRWIDKTSLYVDMWICGLYINVRVCEHVCVCGCVCQAISDNIFFDKHQPVSEVVRLDFARSNSEIIFHTIQL